MPDFQVAIFAADNIINPQDPGNLPSEDASFRSSLNVGDQITWIGGGESLVVSVTDNTDGLFAEEQNDQTLTTGVTFDGVTYAAGQIVTPTYTIVFSGSDGNTYTLTSFNFDENTNNEIPDAVYWEGAIPPQGTVLTVTSEINPAFSTARDYNDFVTCFCSGTLIETADGPKPVETLHPGDMIQCLDGRFEKILLIPHRHVSPAELRRNPKLLPVKITAGALGHGLPVRDTWVSRQHRFYVSSPICQRMFDRQDALIAAIQLTVLPGIYIDDTITDVTYWHLLLPQHDVVYANAAPSESFQMGELALKAMTDDALEEMRAIFPEKDLRAYAQKSALCIPPSKRQKQLVHRHLKNNRPLVRH